MTDKYTEPTRESAETAEPLTHAQASALYFWIGDGGKNGDSPAAVEWRRQRDYGYTNMSFGAWLGETFANNLCPWKSEPAKIAPIRTSFPARLTVEERLAKLQAKRDAQLAEMLERNPHLKKP